MKQNDVATTLAIDFVLNANPREGLRLLQKAFPNLLSGPNGGRIQAIPHLPAVGQNSTSFYAVAAEGDSTDKYLYRYRYAEADSIVRQQASVQHFVQVALDTEPPMKAQVVACTFVEADAETVKLVVEKDEHPKDWVNLPHIDPDTNVLQEPITQRAVGLFYALLAMHRKASNAGGEAVYVPFKPQLFAQRRGDSSTTLHLLADPVPETALGVSAWYHDQDDRVVTVMVPKDRAELWRVGWAVADVLGVAADMQGEVGARNEQLGGLESPLGDESDAAGYEQRAKAELESYVLRQQLRKLQGAYLAQAQTEVPRDEDDQLPGTVKRALDLLRRFPAEQRLDAQVLYVLKVDAESRAMALRLEARGADDLRHDLHRVFPDVLNRMPLWVLKGLELRCPAEHVARLRPELTLMLSLYHAMHPVSEPPETEGADLSLRMALALATAGVGLRGSVAALWGFSASSGTRRMSERLSFPAGWVAPDMERLDPEGDYQVMRKRLLDGDWPALCKSSPWQWMLALVGLLDAGFPQAFDLQPLKEVYLALRAWQTLSGGTDSADPVLEWPFDALPRLTRQQCDALMRDIPKAVRALDRSRGMHLVRVEAPRFRRDRNTDEFVDVGGTGWQTSKPQFTGLYNDTVEQVRKKNSTRLERVWTETRRESDNELLAVHWLDEKLGQWLSSLPLVVDDPEPINVTQAVSVTPDEVSAPAPAEVADAHVQPSISLSMGGGSDANDQPWIDSLNDWQSQTLKDRSGGESGAVNQMAAHRSHLRVALFQWDADESYGHPLSEAGLNGFPFEPTSLDELRSHLHPGGTFKLLNKAAKRGSEHSWNASRKVVSWPEHRRRILLEGALRACKHLNVHLLVLPEVSVRSDTVEWLKKRLANYPGLAVLAGTFRQFRSTNTLDHLTEMLTLLWQPDVRTADGFGLPQNAGPIAFERAKKYRAVAAHELFRPNVGTLAPLYTEAKVLNALRSIRDRGGKGHWSPSELEPLMQALIHGPQKLRYCMELICSELFLLTSPANHVALRQELARVLMLFGDDHTEAKQHVEKDIEALGELLTVAQSQRERRSVLLVPAHTTRSNDYWHAGQASVLASGTATVFCNAAGQGSAGGSCFIGIDSVTELKPEPGGVVKRLTPYHGWHKGILQPNGKGALSKKDQALLVVDLDPVHVVSGRPRPQLLPEPMSLVAYLPVVEVVRATENANQLLDSLKDQLTHEGLAVLKRRLRADAFPPPCGSLHQLKDFRKAFDELQKAKDCEALTADLGGEALDAFAKFFGDAGAVRERIITWLKDRHQQPAPKVRGKIEPAWLDFLVADLTWTHSAAEECEIWVPPWSSTAS